MIPTGNRIRTARHDLIASLEAANAPRYILATLEALRFGDASRDPFSAFVDVDWQRLLQWSDARQLTLMLPDACGPHLPAAIREQIFQRSARYAPRFERLKQDLLEIAQALDRASLEFVLLKGLSHAPAMTPDARLRAQGDIDLWLIGSSVHRAQDVLKSLGYVPTLRSRHRHLSPMARPSNWRWRGDLFDSDMPISVELHYELWSNEAEHFAARGLDQFWSRRTPRDFDGHRIQVLCDEDLIGFAALHLLLHLLHGELPLQRAWEIAHFLQTRAADDPFWATWDAAHPRALRQLETVVFSLVVRWFGCTSPSLLESQVEDLPASIRIWLEKFSLSPLIREWAPNKHEVWLHLALIGSRKKGARVLFRRLAPFSIPAFADRAWCRSFSGKIGRACRQSHFIVDRLVRHLITFVPTLLTGLRWLWLPKG